MSRLILPINSTAVNTASNTYLPVGSRLVGVTGECDTKPTYDFSVVVNTYQAGVGNQYYTIKFANNRNGKRVNLMKVITDITNKNATTTTAGDLSIQVIMGTGVSGQVYYITGSVGN